MSLVSTERPRHTFGLHRPIDVAVVYLLIVSRAPHYTVNVNRPVRASKTTTRPSRRPHLVLPVELVPLARRLGYDSGLD